MDSWEIGEIHPIYGEVCLKGVKGGVPYRSFRDRFGSYTMVSLDFLNKTVSRKKLTCDMRWELIKERFLEECI